MNTPAVNERNAKITALIVLALFFLAVVAFILLFIADQ
jgi:cbb3-type cytochrome oxidase subunit 3